MARILVSRFSAMGDVAMLIPVLYSVARLNPEHEFTLLTQPFFAKLLLNAPANLKSMTIDVKGEAHSFWGLLRYIGRLSDEHFDICIDAHDVLRTKLIRWSLSLRGVKVYHLNKPRKARAYLLANKAQNTNEGVVPPMQNLYERCFREAGLRCPNGDYERIRLDDAVASSEELKTMYAEAFAEEPIVGIAPFASTASKTCDLSLIERVVAHLSVEGIHVYLFGGKGKEADELAVWAQKYPCVRSLAGQLCLSDELLLMSRLCVMLSMDSANMHFASMLGVPVVSVWCATHPYAGFLGMGQRLEDCVQDESLDCRPCSIFGVVKSCKYGDMPCRKPMSDKQIADKLFKYIKE